MKEKRIPKTQWDLEAYTLSSEGSESVPATNPSTTQDEDKTNFYGRQGKPEASKESLQISRLYGQDMAAIKQSSQPRSSSSVTNAPSSSAVVEIVCAAATCQPGEEATAEWMEHLEVSTLVQISSAVSTNTDGNIHRGLIDGTLGAQRTKAAIVTLQEEILKLTE
ncbi:hypothetical protein H8958_003078 [Nasalis larvatus]